MVFGFGSARTPVVQVRRKSAEQFHVRDKLLRKLDDKVGASWGDVPDGPKSLPCHLGGWVRVEWGVRAGRNTLKSTLCHVHQRTLVVAS